MRKCRRPRALRLASRSEIRSPVYSPIFRARENGIVAKHPLPLMRDFSIDRPGASFIRYRTLREALYGSKPALCEAFDYLLVRRVGGTCGGSTARTRVSRGGGGAISPWKASRPIVP